MSLDPIEAGKRFDQILQIIDDYPPKAQFVVLISAAMAVAKFSTMSREEVEMAFKYALETHKERNNPNG